MKFYYLGGITRARTSAVDRILARIRKTCSILRDLLLFFTSRVLCILEEEISKNPFDWVLLCYIVSEAWSVMESNVVKVEKNDTRIVRWLCKC